MKILILMLFLVSCSNNIVVRTPSSKFLAAEAQGKPLKGKVHLYNITGVEAEVDLRNEKVDEALVLTRNPYRFLDLSLSGELGIWGPVDVFHVGGGKLGSDLSGIKVQLFGKNKSEAGKYNFSVAILAGYGVVQNDVEDGVEMELVPLDDDTSSELKISNQTSGVLLGYRPSEKTLVNLGHYIVRHNFYGELDSQNVNLDGKTINYVGNSNLSTLGVFWFAKSAVVGLEWSSQNLKWERTKRTHHVFTNFSLGFNW